MLLAIDIGNTNIVISMYNDGRWTQQFRHITKEVQPEIYYESAFRQLLLEWNIMPSHIKNCIVSSVVPDINDKVLKAFYFVTGHQAKIIDSNVYKLLDMKVPKQDEIGSDLVCNAYAAVKMYNTDCIIVDFGTALTFTVVSPEDGLKGVTIAPGLNTAVHALFSNTALLPNVPLETPKSAIGLNTVSAIQGGIVYGYYGLIKEIIYQIQKELNKKHLLISTGGLSGRVQLYQALFDHHIPYLTLEGMRMVHDYVYEEQCGQK